MLPVHQSGNYVLKKNTVYFISSAWNLRGDTLEIPENCTLVFKKGGSVENGYIVGNETKIQFTKPFIGESLSITGCRLTKKKHIWDKDLFMTVSHTQAEIQTMFDIGDGIKISFSEGDYKNLEKVIINTNVDADFNNSTIFLNHDKEHVGECFYMEPWVDRKIDYFKIKNLKIVGDYNGVTEAVKARRCIQLFFVSDVVLDNIALNKFYSGPSEFEIDSRDLLDKSRIGTSAIAIVRYNKCIINNCKIEDVGREIFWCVPNETTKNMTYFTNNQSTFSLPSGSASFFTLIDGRCEISNNEVYNYNGSAFNVFCYDSKVFNNRFCDGKRSVAIDLSEGTMYRARNVHIYDNDCVNTKGLVAAYGEKIRIENNRWTSNLAHTGDKRCAIITINSREERAPDGEYIGSGNNPLQDTETQNILIKNNRFTFIPDTTKSNIRCASLNGNGISFFNNSMIGMETPVVQLAAGQGFIYSHNIITCSHNGYYPELFINSGKDITVVDNTFYQNHYDRNIVYTILVLKADGKMKYKGNRVTSPKNNTVKYVPCYVKDDSDLNTAEIFVDENYKVSNIETGLKNQKIKIKTNLNQ